MRQECVIARLNEPHIAHLYVIDLQTFEESLVAADVKAACLASEDTAYYVSGANRRQLMRVNLHTLGAEAADEDIHPEVFREAAVIQMTWPGAPTIYYGDEVGLVGWTDPDNRRTFPWGNEDQAMLAFFRALAALREALPMLRRGSVKPLCAGYGYIAYARFDAQSAVAVAVNNTEHPIWIDLTLRDVGIPDGAEIVTRFSTTAQGFDTTDAPVGTVESGVLRFEAPAHSACILARNQQRRGKGKHHGRQQRE